VRELYAILRNCRLRKRNQNHSRKGDQAPTICTLISYPVIVANRWCEKAMSFSERVTYL